MTAARPDPTDTEPRWTVVNNYLLRPGGGGEIYCSSDSGADADDNAMAAEVAALLNAAARPDPAGGEPTCEPCHGTGVLTVRRLVGRRLTASDEPCPRCKGAGKSPDPTDTEPDSPWSWNGDVLEYEHTDGEVCGTRIPCAPVREALAAALAARPDRVWVDGQEVGVQ